MERMDFIESRMELRSCWFSECVGLAATWAHVRDGLGKEGGFLNAGN